MTIFGAIPEVVWQNRVNLFGSFLGKAVGGGEGANEEEKAVPQQLIVIIIFQCQGHDKDGKSGKVRGNVSNLIQETKQKMSFFLIVFPTTNYPLKELSSISSRTESMRTDFLWRRAEYLLRLHMIDLVKANIAKWHHRGPYQSVCPSVSRSQPSICLPVCLSVRLFFSVHSQPLSQLD